NTDDLFVGKTLLHGDVLMWLMKTLLTSGCTNQRGAGQETSTTTSLFLMAEMYLSLMHCQANKRGNQLGSLLTNLLERKFFLTSLVQ
ncbi:hypothetical protein L8S94_13260, partial [Enterobacter kobei]|uniref:hypothetical protein n=1 Tax=Enterobacter kobei TaxID=208224 RepID=UPI002003AF53